VRIGVTRERTSGETRVALAPHAAHELSRTGHRVLVEAGAGEASGISDAAYEEAGARVVGDAAKVWDDSELVVKVYGPVEEERERLRA
jgi:alanine dehydrogenase